MGKTGLYKDRHAGSIIVIYLFKTGKDTDMDKHYIEDERIMMSWMSGSTLHGLRDEYSDIDSKIIGYETAENLLLQRTTDTYDDHTTDTTIMILDRFINLALNGAPNILEGLFAPDEFLIKHDKNADIIRSHAEWFLTRKSMDTMIRMSISIMRKLSKNHNLEYRKSCKFQCESIRLLRATRETLRTGTLISSIDNQELMDIKHGGYMNDGTIDMESWESFYNDELEKTQALYDESTMQETISESTITWCESFMMDINYHRILESR
jgi:predicted nucleotidyltransferase